MGTRKNKRRVKRYSKNTKKRITGGKRRRQARKQTKRYNRRRHSRRQRGGNGFTTRAPSHRRPLVITPRSLGGRGDTPSRAASFTPTLTPGGGGGGGGGTSDPNELEHELGVIPERLRPRSALHPYGNMELFTSPAPWVDFRDPRHRQPSASMMLFDAIDSIRKSKGIASTDLYHTFDKHGKVSVIYKGDPEHRVFINNYILQNFKPWFDKWLRDRYGGDEHADVEWVPSDNSLLRRGGRKGRWQKMGAAAVKAAAAAAAAAAAPAAEKPESCMVCGDDAHPGTLPCCGAPIPVCDTCIRPLASMPTVECPLCRSVGDKGSAYRNWIAETVQNLPAAAAAAAAEDTGEAKRNMPEQRVARIGRQRSDRFLAVMGWQGFPCYLCNGLGDTIGADVASGRGKFSICTNCGGTGNEGGTTQHITPRQLTTIVNSDALLIPGVPGQTPAWPIPPYPPGFEWR